ncbi:MAG: hypothetical protein WCI22_17955, partial [Actinomycetota bacterium]
VLVLATAAWFGVVKPAIRTAADDAVRRAAGVTVSPGSTTVTVPGNTVPPGSTTPPTAADPKVPAGSTIVNVPLPVSVKQGQSGTSQYTVPAGKKLRLTDLIIQNPQLDQGTLVIARGKSALFTYSLTNMFNDVDRPLVTPLELASGEQLVVTVACMGVGDQTATSCAPKVLLSGLLLPAG